MSANFLPVKEGRVTYGGGAKGRIVGKGTNIPDFPDLKNVFYVEGLTANLISISQLCDDGMLVKFDKHSCEVFDNSNKCVMFGNRSPDNCYQANREGKCHLVKLDETDLWHQRLRHANMKNIQKLLNCDVVQGLPKLEFKSDKVCGPCQKGKQTKSSHPMLSMVSTKRCFELLHMDVMGPIEVESLGGKRYVLVCADDFSRFTWVEFLKEKSDTFQAFRKLHKRFCSLYDCCVARTRTDHGREFENSTFADYCLRKGISHEFSAPKTPQQNGVAERKNRTLQEMVRVMLHTKHLSKRLWAEAANTACHLINRVYLRPGTKVTPYEILKGNKPNLKYLRVFGCVCYILNDRDHLSKLDQKDNKGLFLGYAPNSRAYRVFNLFFFFF